MSDQHDEQCKDGWKYGVACSHDEQCELCECHYQPKEDCKDLTIDECRLAINMYIDGIKGLEAENLRLRGALEDISNDYCGCDLRDPWAGCDCQKLRDKAKEALAEKGQGGAK